MSARRKIPLVATLGESRPPDDGLGVTALTSTKPQGRSGLEEPPDVSPEEAAADQSNAAETPSLTQPSG
jgi:hypothetical protein